MLKKCFFLISSLFIFSGCVTKETVVYRNYDMQQTLTKVSYNNYPSSENNKIVYDYETKYSPNNTDETHVKNALMDFYNEWKNVKYKFGGSSKKGIDCSAFTQKAFKEKFNLKIPRSTITQVKKGEKISKSELQLGDLVFFKSKKHGRHVGIYMGDNKFLHASIKGIKFSSLDKNYYKNNYWTSRRILN